MPILSLYSERLCSRYITLYITTTCHFNSVNCLFIRNTFFRNATYLVAILITILVTILVTTQMPQVAYC